MTYLDFFRLQAKNLYRAWKTHKENEEGFYDYESPLFDVNDFLRPEMQTMVHQRPDQFMELVDLFPVFI